jgi:streptogramin lyase
MTALIRAMLLALTALSAGQDAAAQHGAAAQQNVYDVAWLTTKDGLSQSYVYCMLQDHDGFLWLGTRNGLNRFDGYAFKVWYHEPFDAGTLSHNIVMALAEDAEGNLWIGTHGGGVCRLDRRREKFFCFRHDPGNPRSLTTDMVNALAIDARGRLWIGTWGGGLCMIDTREVNRALASGEAPRQNLRRYNPDPGNSGVPATNTVCGLACDDCSVWMTYPGGVDRFFPSSGAWSHFVSTNTRDRLEHAARRSIESTSRYHIGILFTEGTVYCGSSGLQAIERDTVCRVVDSHHSEVGPVCRGITGDVFFGETRLRVLHSDGAIDSVILPAAGARSIMSLCADARGTVWVGTDDGVVRLTRHRSPFRYIPIGDASGGLARVNAMLQAGDGTVLVSVKERLLRYRPADRILEAHPPISLGGASEAVEWTLYALSEDPSGELLCGNGYGLLAMQRTATVAKRIDYRMPLGRRASGTFYGRTFGIHRDRRGTVWCYGQRAGQGFLSRLTADHRAFAAGGTLERELGRRSGSGVWNMIEDSRGRLWFATTNGVIRFDPSDSSLRHFTHDAADARTLAHNEVWAMLLDRTGRLWIGTMGGGLEQYDEERDRFIHHTVRNGLPSNVVKSLLEDAHGGLWIGTDNGLSHFDPAIGRFRNYRTSEMREAGSFQPRAACALRDGSFLFGMEHGLLQMHPDSVRDDTTTAPLVFTRVTVQGRERAADVLDGDTVLLGPSENAVSFAFAALDYRNSEQIEYAYRLDGAHRAWNLLGQRHECSFAELPPGRYVLLIRSTNADGRWSARTLRVTIMVLPPFYLRWWFLLPSILILAGAAGALLVWRIRAIRRRAEHDRRLVESELKALRLQMNPHFFFNALNAIQNYLAARDERQANAFISRFARLMRMILENSRSATVTIAEELDAVTQYMELEAMRFEHRFAYRLEVDPGIDTRMRIPSMLIQPYVENAIRHGLQPLATGGLLTVALRRLDDAISCRIEDNGIGRDRAAAGDPQSERRSLGMHITRERLEILNATRKRRMALIVTDLHDGNGAPSGTRVEIVIPFE